MPGRGGAHCIGGHRPLLKSTPLPTASSLQRTTLREGKRSESRGLRAKEGGVQEEEEEEEKKEKPGIVCHSLPGGAFRRAEARMRQQCAVSSQWNQNRRL